MSSEEEKSRGFVVGHHHESYPPPPPPPPSPPSEQLPSPAPPPYYGTFQGVPTYAPPHTPAVGFPQPVAPPGAYDPSGRPPPPGQYYAQGYQTVPGYAVAEGRPLREHRLPCCGLGLGWCLFLLGFFLAGIPWYVGAILLICSRRSLDYREKPGYILCTIAAVLVTVAIILGVTRRDHDW